MTACRRVFVLLALTAPPAAAVAQRAPGRPIGTVGTVGQLIHLELEAGAVDPARLFDLDRSTLRFTPEGAGYRVENVALSWDPDFGAPLQGTTATLHNFRFPFSGRSWDTFNVAIGAIMFTGEPAVAAAAPGSGRGGGGGGGRGARAGFPMERYVRLRTAGATFINVMPGIAAFVKPNLNGQRHVKELPDRVVVTWTLSEPSGGIQAFTWVPTVNRIQAVLHSDGTIELSYNDVSARDAIVGVFPMVTSGVEKVLGKITDADDTGVAGHLDVNSVTLTAIDGLFVQAKIETRDPVVAPGDPRAIGVTYRVSLSGNAMPADLSQATVVWTIRGGAVGGGRGGGPGSTTGYTAVGAGVEPEVTVSGNVISVRGPLPFALSGFDRLNVAADAGTSAPASVADRVAPAQVSLAGVRSPELDLSNAHGREGPFSVAWEGFHWSESPRAQDVACSVITALGDRFDFIASYSDFRVDDPEGGTPSTGPRGGNVTGIGGDTRDVGAFCSQGRLQFMFAQPVSTSAVQIQERSPDGRMRDYNYAVSQIAHELGHRWAAMASAMVDGVRTPLGPTHWSGAVHLPAAFPYGRSWEADIMGGSTWQENPDGTFTQLDRDYYNPAKGWSWLALYLMGLARPEEVPPFFMLRNMQRTDQTDADGRPIYRGDKTVITIDDVIAAMGPRSPSFEGSQKQFNTAVVVITEPGKKPTPRLLEAAENIGRKYIEYWATTTGGRSTMTVNQR